MCVFTNMSQTLFFCANPAMQVQIPNFVNKCCLMRWSLLTLNPIPLETRRYFCNVEGVNSKVDSGEKKSEETLIDDHIIEEPTNCCMSGCANCVWIQYAEKLSQLYQDGGEKARKAILNQINDPNMKAFLLTELKTVISKKS